MERMSIRLSRLDSDHPVVAIAASLGLAISVLIAALVTLPVSPRPLDAATALIPISTLTQASANSEDDDEVPPEQVEKYIAVYRAMQLDHTLTVEQAASQHGMTLEAFRQLENRVQRDDAATEHVRDALKASSANPAPSGSPTRAGPAK
ncbi:MAG: hypothetical protein ACREQD_01185 [Candidatus Binataceae bacterium]